MTSSHMRYGLALILGCGDADPASEGSGEATTSTVTTAPTGDETGADGACDCAQSQGGAESHEVIHWCNFDELPGQIPGCPAERTCDHVTVQCPMDGYGLDECEVDWVYATEALTCTLEALMDRRPGVLVIDDTDESSPYAGNTRYALHVREDGTAVVTRCQGADAGWTWQSSDVELETSSHFEGCLAASSDPERHACVLAGFAAAQELPLCPG